MKKIVLTLIVFVLSIVMYAQGGEFNAMISPNPARDFCEINTSEDVTVRMYDMQGKIILQQDRGKQFDLDLREVPEGIYFLHLISDHRIQTFRLVRTYDRI